MDHPYQRELDCCESLTGYLHALKVRTGQTVDNEVAARKAQKQIHEEQVKERLNDLVSAGKV